RVGTHGSRTIARIPTSLASPGMGFAAATYRYERSPAGYARTWPTVGVLRDRAYQCGRVSGSIGSIGAGGPRSGSPLTEKIAERSGERPSTQWASTGAPNGSAESKNRLTRAFADSWCTTVMYRPWVPRSSTSIATGSGGRISWRVPLVVGS